MVLVVYSVKLLISPKVSLGGSDSSSTAFATFTGTDTSRQARIPVTPFMGILGVAPLRTGMYRTFPPTSATAMAAIPISGSW